MATDIITQIEQAAGLYPENLLCLWLLVPGNYPVVSIEDRHSILVRLLSRATSLGRLVVERKIYLQIPLLL